MKGCRLCRGKHSTYTKGIVQDKYNHSDLLSVPMLRYGVEADSRGDQEAIPSQKRLQHTEERDFALVCRESDLSGISRS